MQNLLYTVAVVVLILWALGYFVYNIGSIVHIIIVSSHSHTNKN